MAPAIDRDIYALRDSFALMLCVRRWTRSMKFAFACVHPVRALFDQNNSIMPFVLRLLDCNASTMPVIMIGWGAHFVA